MSEKKLTYSEILFNGIRSGLKTLWMLTKVIVPVYFLVTLLGYTPILTMLAQVFEPVMVLFGLPGEAALALVLGNVLNLYAGIGVIVTLGLTTKQMTIMALMLSFSHSLVVETAVIKKTGMKGYISVAIRICLACATGIIGNLLIK